MKSGNRVLPLRTDLQDVFNPFFTTFGEISLS
jgi:hypothetical protein